MMTTLDVHQQMHEDRMRREGISQCDECAEWCDDVKPCIIEKNMGDSGTGYAHHDVPVNAGNLCAPCREECGAEVAA